MQNRDVQKQIEGYAAIQDGPLFRDGKAVSGVNLKARPSNAKPPQKSRTIFWKRILKVALICSGSLLGFLLVLFLLAVSLPGKTIVFPITIGDTTITKEDVNVIRDAMQKTADKFDNEVSFSNEAGDKRTIDEIASDSAIMNAALKDRAKTCGIELTSDVQGARGQNETWQDLLENCTIAKKELLLVGVVFDAPYFANMSNEEADAAYSSAKEWLNSSIMPLVASGEDKVAIANSNGLRGFTALKEPDAGIDRPETFVWDTLCDGRCFNDSFSSANAEEFPGDLGHIVDQNQLIRELHNVGDHTEVFTASSGIFGIMRLESNTGGEFDSWNDFLAHYKDTYVNITPVSSVTSFIKELSIKVLQFFLPFVDVYAAMAPCSLKHHNAVEIFLGVKYVTSDSDGWAWVGGRAAHRASMTVSSQCAGAASISVSSVADDGVTYTGRYADCNNYGPYVSNISYSSSAHGVDHINFYCGESRRTCYVGSANDSGIQVSSGVITLGSEYAVYRCDRDEQYKTCNSSVASYEEVNSVTVPFRWYGGANAGSDQLRVTVYITDQPEEPPLMCYDASGVIRALTELDITHGIAGWPESEIRASSNPADGYSCYIAPPAFDQSCYDWTTGTMVSLPSSRFQDAEPGGLCTPRHDEETHSSAPADSYVCRTSTVPPYTCNSWGSPGRQDVKARFSMSLPMDFPGPFVRNTITDNIRFKHNLNSFRSTYNLTESHSFSYRYPYTYTYTVSCGTFFYPRTCRRTRTVYRSASASTTHSLNFYFGQNNPSGATTTGQSSNSVSNRPSSSLAGTTKSKSITSLISGGVLSAMVPDDRLLNISADRIAVTQSYVGTTKYCQSLNLNWSQTFNPSNITVYANHSGASPSSKIFPHNSVTLSGNTNSTSACFTVPFLWAVYPKVEKVNGINEDSSLEVGEKATVPWRIYAASNKGSSGTCAPGVTIDVYMTINGSRSTSSSGNYRGTNLGGRQGVSCGGISGEFNLEGAVVGDKVCLYAGVGSITNDPYLMRISDSDQLGSYSGPRGDASSCYEIVKRASIQIHGADSWSGTDSSNGGFLAKNSANTYNQCTKSGSWSQYGLFATGTIDETFGSAGFLKSLCNNTYHLRLKFANNTTPHGRFSTTHQLTNARNYYTNTKSCTYPRSSLGSDTISQLANYASNDDGYIIHCFANATTANLSGGQVPNGKNLVLIFGGDLNITSNIIYTDNFSDIYSIPNLTIVAKNITITAGVNRLDGVYRAEEIFDDCNTDQFGYTANNTCNNTLTVNGAIIANKTKFQRTSGSEHIINNPGAAEYIKYNPTVYLSNYARQRLQQKDLKTILRREVAPRW